MPAGFTSESATGAASGIGAGVARRVAAPGVRLLLHTGNNLDALKAVSVPAQLVRAAGKAFGRVDQIVSNAGKAQRATFEEVSNDVLEHAFAMMPIAFFRLAKEALPDLRMSPQGRVVAVSSFVAHAFGTNDMHFPATGAAKAVLEALAKSLASFYGDLFK